jgi:hypothetical protein
VEQAREPGHGTMADIDDREVAAAIHCLRTDAMTAEVVSRFRAESIRCICLKGPGLVRWLYPDMSRTYRDTDLLVRPDQIATAEAALKDMGFEHPPLDDLPGDRPWHAHMWILPGRNLGVDLHRFLIGCKQPAEVVWAAMSADTDVLELQGVAVEIPAPHAMAMHVALHAAQDGLRGTKTLRDLHRALEVAPDELWRKAASLAHEVGAEEAFAAGLRLSPEGRAVAQRLGLGATTSMETALRAESAPQLALSLEWLSRHRSVRSKAVFAVTKLFPSPAYMRSWTPVARRGAVGLALAYAWRLLWFAAQLWPTVRTWMRARRRRLG